MGPAVGPEYEKRCHSLARPVATSWRVDETYVSVRGRWHYLYRAVDKHGKTVDFLLRRDRGIAAAQAFFRKALISVAPRVPRKITLDGHVPSRRALWLLRREHRCWRNVTGSDQPIPQQHHRAGSPGDQTPMRIDVGLQVIRERLDHNCGYRTRASYSQAAVRPRAESSASRMVSQGRVGDRTRVEVAETDPVPRASTNRRCTRTIRPYPHAYPGVLSRPAEAAGVVGRLLGRPRADLKLQSTAQRNQCRRRGL